jgi:activator of 2-hydroxyglutaryl-CoA dehydratase/predicted nucleotide-binding protein (sugar kinase/HSP70/actin superfamily)
MTIIKQTQEQHSNKLLIGVDVGSTTVKAVVVDPVDRRILWKDYQRHETRQPEKTLEFLQTIEKKFPQSRREDITVYMTGSGSGVLCEPVGARFIQEVNAVTVAVEALHPDAGSVVELGGQDAKIIIFQQSKDSDERRAITSMNDKCASGTGATIDKCMIKVGLPAEALSAITFDDTRLHHVAAKCGVFAETDIVNLVKTGIAAEEIMNSLADAIVHQNLSVLARGNTLQAKVLLLGGPNTYLPFLQDCWRKRIPETWAARDYEYDRDIPLDELILVPDNAEYFAAYGAVLFGLLDCSDADKPIYRGLEPLHIFCTSGRSARLNDNAGPPLVNSSQALRDFTDEFRIPTFKPPRFQRGQLVRGVVGLDGGSTSSKAVLVAEDGTVLCKAYRLSKGNPIQDSKELLAELKQQVESQGAQLEVFGFGATGYAAPVLEESLRADVNIVETIAHMMAAHNYFPQVDVICDIGGQDIKVLFLENDEIKDFKLSNQCSAGNGMLLQAMADQFAVPVEDYAEVAFAAKLSPDFNYGCAVFLDSDRVNFQKEGYCKEELLAGLARVLPKNIWQYVVGVPRLAELGHCFVLQGGTQKNQAALKAQVDYIRERVPNAEIYVHPHCGEAGAIGAAMETLRVVKNRGSSSFIGLDAAINLDFQTTSDETTTCHFCTNNCTRTFIDTQLPDGGTTRYIAGFSCEQGTVESKDALKVLVKRRRALCRQYPNMVELEGTIAFKHLKKPETLPEANTQIAGLPLRKGWLARFSNMSFNSRPKGFQRSSASTIERRKNIRIGLPRVLNNYSIGPLWRAYFETLGIPRRQIIWSDETSEEMFAEGGKYGSVDPCYPSKCAQAHIHNLLFDKHLHKRTGPLDYIFFPCVTHLPNFISHTVDDTTCPMVSGTPKVLRAAFTKEVNFFDRARVEYLDPGLTLNEPNLFNEQLWQTWGERLQISRDEHDFALKQGWQALANFEQTLQDRGRAILDEVEQTGRIAILMLGRPYHADPGLHHDIPEELQALGYPILSLRSLPRDKPWLEHLFHADLKAGRISDVFDIRDVWPENYSTNSAQKVWAAKIAARHPNLAVLDISSFKCGHDAPTYGIIDAILKAADTPRLIMHDLDANKPGGSIAIRTRTFAYSLERRSELLLSQHEGTNKPDDELYAHTQAILDTQPPPQEQIIPVTALKQSITEH